MDNIWSASVRVYIELVGYAIIEWGAITMDTTILVAGLHMGARSKPCNHEPREKVYATSIPFDYGEEDDDNEMKKTISSSNPSKSR